MGKLDAARVRGQPMEMGFLIRHSLLRNKVEALIEKLRLEA